MATVKSDIDVTVPITTAYNQWTQFESFPQFLSGVDEVVQKTDTLTHWKVSIAGVTREFDAEITEQHPDERIAWKSTGGEDHAGVVTFYRLNDDETRISVQLDWTPQGIVEKAGALLQVDDIQIGRDLKKFKELIESNGFETGAWRGSVEREQDATGR
ncbi:SRPBCC family protein [Mycetocola miduiensis]|uniref:Polyketide cyclase / dehydrase and lipid transport n=1 Tax=Mycetocola miduiensis TaxID=995034 RepID=A0A1I5D5G4_9MICO|nr:SRPBCC family protein [Mycetocola miduiensis]SFN94356.1 Polyketide cyclase / dehydrase and lipid transport [Mycetocola miduiensis]